MKQNKRNNNNSILLLDNNNAQEAGVVVGVILTAVGTIIASVITTITKNTTISSCEQQQQQYQDQDHDDDDDDETTSTTTTTTTRNARSTETTLTTTSTITTPPTIATNLQRRLTPIGRYTMISETSTNPSIMTMFMKLSPITSNSIKKNNNNNNNNNDVDNGNNNINQNTTTTTTTHNHNNKTMNMNNTIMMNATSMKNLWIDRHMFDHHERFHYTLSKYDDRYFHDQLQQGRGGGRGGKVQQQQEEEKQDKQQQQQEEEKQDLRLDVLDRHIFDDHFFVLSSSSLKEKSYNNLFVRTMILNKILQLQTTRWDLTNSLWNMYIINNHNKNQNKNNTSILHDDDDNDCQVLQQQEQEETTTTTTTNNHNNEEEEETTTTTLLFLRAHHVIGDGVSMSTALMDLVDEANILKQKMINGYNQYMMIQSNNNRRRKKKKKQQQQQSLLQRLYHQTIQLLRILYSILQVFIHHAYISLSSILWIQNDPWMMIKKLAAVHEEKEKKRSISYSIVAPIKQVKWILQQISKGSSVHKDKNSSHDHHDDDDDDVLVTDEKAAADKKKNKKKNKKKLTINDLFLYCINEALIRQLQEHRERILISSSTSTIDVDLDSSIDGSSSSSNNNNNNSKKKKMMIPPLLSKMNIALPVHLMGGIVLPGISTMSNNLGAILVQLPGEEEEEEEKNKMNYDDDDHQKNLILQRFFAVHDELYKMKNTPAPYVSHYIAKLCSIVTETFVQPIVGKEITNRMASFLLSYSTHGIIATVSNNRGPDQYVHMTIDNGHTSGGGGNVRNSSSGDDEKTTTTSAPTTTTATTATTTYRINEIYGFVPMPPNIPIGIVIMSYADHINISVTAETWIIPNTDRFCSYILEEYLKILNVATRM